MYSYVRPPFVRITPPNISSESALIYAFRFSESLLNAQPRTEDIVASHTYIKHRQQSRRKFHLTDSVLVIVVEFCVKKKIKRGIEVSELCMYKSTAFTI